MRALARFSFRAFRCAPSLGFCGREARAEAAGPAAARARRPATLGVRRTLWAGCRATGRSDLILKGFLRLLGGGAESEGPGERASAAVEARFQLT